ncbi:MAG TPA: HAMP domain-containing sensor histidine kinase, partial [Thermomonas sp.]|nr:HAMP domain-containing sensor histidine kinase [Thermomonas sp.]
LFAYSTTLLRTRVENQLLSDALNRNIDAYASAFERDPTNATFAFEGVQGWVYANERLANAPADWRGLRDGIHELHGVEENGQAFAYKLAVRRTPTHAFFLAYDLTQTLQGQAQQNRLLVAAVVLFTALALVLGWWSASRVMAPVSDLAQRLRRSGTSSDPELLAPSFAEDEVGELARALDDYAGRLTEVVQRDREFNADVSHELRTPLAVIRGAVELMLAKPDVDERSRTRLLRIQRAEQQCTDLISALLLLSRNERAVGSCDVARVAQQLLDNHRAQLAGKPLVLRMEGAPSLLVDAPESAVAVALGNLIGNAVKYTQSGDVVVRVGEGAVEVVDSGPGLSAEDAARLFERGYRGTHAGHSQGGGIGLSIVRRLCALYGWDVRVRPGDTQGVVATLSFA